MGRSVLRYLRKDPSEPNSAMYEVETRDGDTLGVVCRRGRVWVGYRSTGRPAMGRWENKSVGEFYARDDAGMALLRGTGRS